MARILMAGLPAELEDWLKERLKGTAGLSIDVTHGGEETLAELARGYCGLLVLDDSLEDPPASEVLLRSRSELGLGDGVVGEDFLHGRILVWGPWTAGSRRGTGASL